MICLKVLLFFIVLCILITYLVKYLTPVPVSRFNGGASTNETVGEFKDLLNKNKNKLQIIEHSTDRIKDLEDIEIKEYMIFKIKNADTDFNFLYTLDTFKSGKGEMESIHLISEDNIEELTKVTKRGHLPIFLDVPERNRLTCGTIMRTSDNIIHILDLHNFGDGCKDGATKKCSSSFLKTAFKTLKYLINDVLEYNGSITLTDTAMGDVVLKYKHRKSKTYLRSYNGDLIYIPIYLSPYNFNNNNYDKNNLNTISIYHRYGFKYDDIKKFEKLAKNKKTLFYISPSEDVHNQYPSFKMTAPNLDCFDRCDKDNDKKCPNKKSMSTKSAVKLNNIFEFEFV